MSAGDRAQGMVRAVCLLLAAFTIFWPLVANERLGAASFVLAAHFILAGLSPRLLGPWICKGLLLIATLVAFYDPPSSIRFSPESLAMALALVALALMLMVPDLMRALVGKKHKE